MQNDQGNKGHTRPLCLSLTIVIISVAGAAAVAFIGLSLHRCKPLARFPSHGFGGHGVLRSVSFSGDGSKLAVSDLERTTIWKLRPLRRLATFPGADTIFAEQGQKLATVTNSGDEAFRDTVTIIDETSWRVFARFRHPKPISSFALSRNAEFVAVGLDEAGRVNSFSSGDCDLILWNANTKKIRWAINTHQRGVPAMSFSPDGKLLATGARDGSVRILECESGKQIVALHGNEECVHQVTFSNAGRILVSCSSGTVFLWDSHSGKLLAKIFAHAPLSDPFRMRCCVALDDPHQIIATGSPEDRTIKLWDMVDGKQLGTIARNWASSPGVTAIAFAPDGRYIAAGVEIGLVEILDIDQARPPVPGE
jgi:WD40 repeat protein